MEAMTIAIISTAIMVMAVMMIIMTKWKGSAKRQ